MQCDRQRRSPHASAPCMRCSAGPAHSAVPLARPCRHQLHLDELPAVGPGHLPVPSQRLAGTPAAGAGGCRGRRRRGRHGGGPGSGSSWRQGCGSEGRPRAVSSLGSLYCLSCQRHVPLSGCLSVARSALLTQDRFVMNSTATAQSALPPFVPSGVLHTGHGVSALVSMATRSKSVGGAVRVRDNR